MAEHELEDDGELPLSIQRLFLFSAIIVSPNNLDSWTIWGAGKEDIDKWG